MVRTIKITILEHFIVWIRANSLSNFIKLWGRIDHDLPVGNYTIEINNSNYLINYKIDFDVDYADYYKGKKHIFISNGGHFGGKNVYL